MPSIGGVTVVPVCGKVGLLGSMGPVGSTIGVVVDAHDAAGQSAGVRTARHRVG